MQIDFVMSSDGLLAFYKARIRKIDCSSLDGEFEMARCQVLTLLHKGLWIFAKLSLPSPVWAHCVVCYTRSRSELQIKGRACMV